MEPSWQVLGPEPARFGPAPAKALAHNEGPPRIGASNVGP
jgi:hypothetical protein